MGIDDAVTLLRECIRALGLPEETLKDAVGRYSTGLSFASPTDWQLHETDIAGSLSAKLSGE